MREDVEYYFDIECQTGTVRGTRISLNCDTYGVMATSEEEAIRDLKEYLEVEDGEFSLIRVTNMGMVDDE